MSQNRSPADPQTLLDDAWESVVGGMDWMKSVLVGEFDDHRPLSAVVADMLVSFVPGVVIVTSARDAVAVILRLANHPEKREELMEWVLLSACLIVIALPVAMAAGGAAAAGVGAVVGGIAGSELGAALRAVMLLLIKEASKLVELVRFLQKFIKGDVLKFLRAVKFVNYEKALLQAVSKVTSKLVEIVTALRTHLEGLRYFETVKTTIAKLAEWEKKFYSVQQDALIQLPKALAELDARLAKLLAQTAPKEAHTVAAGVPADKTVTSVPAKQRILDTPGKVLPKTGIDTAAGIVTTKTGKKAGTTTKSKPKPVSVAPPKDKPAHVKPPPHGTNAKKQAVADATVAADRERITRLSKDGKIAEARAILQPHLDAAKAATTPAEKKAAMDAIIQRLDVTSPKEKMFWSGDKKLAARVATARGKTILEQTPGGQVIDDWGELNSTFSWDNKDMPPYGWDLWGNVSAEYSKGAVGEVDVVQAIKSFPSGGPTWKGREWPTIVSEGKVTLLNIVGMDDAGNVVETMKVKPDSVMAEKLFGGK
jgi:hypothetical protein